LARQGSLVSGSYGQGLIVDPPDHHALIDAIYDGILAPEGFNRGLQVVKDAFGVELSYLLLWDRTTDFIRVIGAAGMLSQFQTDYESHYQFKDPAKEGFPSIPVGEWWIDAEQLGPARMKSSAFHEEFLRSYDLASFMTSPVFRSPDAEVALGLLRSRSAGVFTREQAAAIQPYIPHIRRAALLREQMGELTGAAELTQTLLEHLTFGVVIIDSRLRVLSLNNRGRLWLAALGPPSRWQHRLPGSTVSFEHMIRAACRPQNPAPVQGTMLQVLRRAPCKLLVLPLAATHRFSLGTQQPAALAMFSELRPSTRLLPIVLRELYDLNRSEARLTLCLADGARLWEVAEKLHITRETARTTLKIVFRKTGTSSQAQLVRLLSVLTAIDTPLPPV
jgi:DNA-binding CsgD family transcriptional regulator